ncbi:MAG: Hsp33 family molecular chaperone HslO [Thomasclavelia sp.]|jgi:molecular chaperone Hsp33|nr:Hsp33 family molecular chaperone HslO [Thomasclavelia sp.]
MKDYLVRGLVNSKNCRVFACNTTKLTEEARVKHDMWPTASAALGRVMAVTLMMGAMNKSHDKISITINGGGPIGTIITTTNSDGTVKGFVGDPHTHYTYNDTGHLAVGIAVGKEGTLQVIRDMGLKEPFTGTVPLQTGEIGDDFSYYFMVSEQTPSVVSVGVLVDEDNSVLSAGGFIIQLLPEATEDDISYIENKIKDFPPISKLIHEGKTPEEVLKMLFDDVEITDHQDLSFKCDCSKEKFESGLMTLPTDEIQAMIDEDNGCEVHCQFCGKDYKFTKEDLQKILKEKK